MLIILEYANFNISPICFKSILKIASSLIPKILQLCEFCKSFLPLHKLNNLEIFIQIKKWLLEITLLKPFGKLVKLQLGQVNCITKFRVGQTIQKRHADQFRNKDSHVRITNDTKFEAEGANISLGTNEMTTKSPFVLESGLVHSRSSASRLQIC